MSLKLKRDDYRWGFQAAVCAFFTSMLCTVPFFHNLFGMSGAWVVQTSLSVLEETTGATLKKSLERIVGTVFGGLSAYLLVYLSNGHNIHVNSYKISSEVKVGLLFAFISTPFLWGYIRYKFQNNKLIGTYGLVTSNFIFAGLMFSRQPFTAAMWRIVAVILGIFINYCVINIIMPTKASDQIKNKIIRIYGLLSEMLEPIVQCEADFHPSVIGEIIKANAETMKTISSINKKKSRRRKLLKPATEAKNESDQLKHKLIQKNYRTKQSADKQSLVSKKKHTSTRENKPCSENLTGLSTKRLETVSRHFCSRAWELQQKLDQKTQSINNSVISMDPTRLSQFVSEDCETYLPHNESLIIPVPSQGASLLEGVSRASSKQSTFSRSVKYQDVDIENIKNKMYRDLVNEYTREISVAEKQRQEQFKGVFKTLQKCQQSLTEIPPLFIAARQEIMDKHRFPTERYRALYSATEQLVHLISSLYFSLDCQLVQMSKAKLESLHTIDKYSDSNIATFSDSNWLNNPEMDEMLFDVSLDHFQSKVLGNTKPPMDYIKQKMAGVLGGFFFTEIFTGMINHAVTYIQKTLKSLAISVKNNQLHSDVKANVQGARDAINALCSMRKDRSAWFQKVIDIGTLAHETKKWPEHSKPTLLPWEILMGIDIQTFHDMTQGECRMFWNAYWKAQDRLSVTSGTLMLLADQLNTISTYV